MGDLPWKSVELAFTGGKIESAEAEHGLSSFPKLDAVGIGDMSGSGAVYPSGKALTVTFTADTNMDDVEIDFASSSTAIVGDGYPTIEWSSTFPVASIVQDTRLDVYAFAPGTEITSIELENPTDTLAITPKAPGLSAQMGSGFFGLARLDGSGTPIEQGVPLVSTSEALAPDAAGARTSVVKSPVSPAYGYVTIVLGAFFFDPCETCGFPAGGCTANKAGDACVDEAGSTCFIAEPACACESVQDGPDALIPLCAPEGDGTCGVAGVYACLQGADPCVPVAESCYLGPPSPSPSPPYVATPMACACRGSLPSALSFVPGDNYVDITIEGNSYQYPVDYGTNKCAAWDAGRPPYCAAPYVDYLTEAADWCSSPWCFVDADDCSTASDSSNLPGLSYIWCDDSTATETDDFGCGGTCEKEDPQGGERPTCTQGADCGGQIFNECGTACPLICGQPAPEMCSENCVAEYQCPSGQCFDESAGTCSLTRPPARKCELGQGWSEFEDGVYVENGESYTDPKNPCKQGTCDNGLLIEMAIDCMEVGCDDPWCREPCPKGQKLNMDDPSRETCCGECVDISPSPEPAPPPSPGPTPPPSASPLPPPSLMPSPPTVSPQPPPLPPPPSPSPPAACSKKCPTDRDALATCSSTYETFSCRESYVYFGCDCSGCCYEEHSPPPPPLKPHPPPPAPPPSPLPSPLPSPMPSPPPSPMPTLAPPPAAIPRDLPNADDHDDHDHAPTQEREPESEPSPAPTPPPSPTVTPSPAPAPVPQNVCCLALTATCLACSTGLSVSEYCQFHPDTMGCASPPVPLPSPLPSPPAASPLPPPSPAPPTASPVLLPPPPAPPSPSPTPPPSSMPTPPPPPPPLFKALYVAFDLSVPSSWSWTEGLESLKRSIAESAAAGVTSSDVAIEEAETTRARRLQEDGSTTLRVSIAATDAAHAPSHLTMAQCGDGAHTYSICTT